MDQSMCHASTPTTINMASTSSQGAAGDRHDDSAMSEMQDGINLVARNQFKFVILQWAPTWCIMNLSWLQGAAGGGCDHHDAREVGRHQPQLAEPRLCTEGRPAGHRRDPPAGQRPVRLPTTLRSHLLACAVVCRVPPDGPCRAFPRAICLVHTCARLARSPLRRVRVSKPCHPTRCAACLMHPA